jgi:ribose 5-phosphate isomerase A
LPLSDIAEIDLCIDGVDEIDPELRAIKGAGGAMLREKIVASAARRMIAIADGSKAVPRLGTRVLPVEVLPLARTFAEHRLVKLHCDPVLRSAEGQAVLTDQGNLIFDCHFADLGDLEALDARLSAIPGLVGHGLFLTEIDALYLGGPDGVIRTQRDSRTD